MCGVAGVEGERWHDVHMPKRIGRPPTHDIDDDDGVKQRFIAWLLSPAKDRNPKTMEEFAQLNHVTRRQLTNWKTKDREFIEAWEMEYLRTIGNPERKNTIMETLYRTATDPDDPKHVAAAKQYFEIEGSLKPTKHQVEISKPVTDLSDDELDEIVAAKIARVRGAA